jgi:catechol 2,3-dioxygenase-like lactoylglutathione lyase family enzyme
VEQRLSLITLGVSDLSRARSFYEELGWGGAQQPDDEVCFFQAGGRFSVCGLPSEATVHQGSSLLTTFERPRRSARYCWKLSAPGVR